MTRAMARDFGESNIRVNCVVPGAIRTPRQMKRGTHRRRKPRSSRSSVSSDAWIPMHVAAMVLFLASSDSAMCTAHNYWVDGGYR